MEEGITRFLLLVGGIVIAVIVLGLAMSYLGGGAANLQIAMATGHGSDSGASATVNLRVKNVGGSTARILGVWFEGESAGVTLQNATCVNCPGTIYVGVQAPQPADLAGVAGITIPKNGEASVLFKLTGNGLYPGAKVHVYIVYQDASSGANTTTDAVVPLS